MSGLPPFSVAPFSRAQHAPAFSWLFCDSGWQARLDSARQELRKYGEVTAAIALPSAKDPALYHWPVTGRRVAICGRLNIARLCRLLAALLRDGAQVVSGIDPTDVLYTAVAKTIEVAA